MYIETGQRHTNDSLPSPHLHPARRRALTIAAIVLPLLIVLDGSVLVLCLHNTAACYWTGVALQGTGLMALMAVALHTLRAPSQKVIMRLEEQQQKGPLVTLPVELLGIIAENLPLESIVRLRQTCKHLHKKLEYAAEQGLRRGIRQLGLGRPGFSIPEGREIEYYTHLYSAMKRVFLWGSTPLALFKEWQKLPDAKKQQLLNNIVCVSTPNNQLNGVIMCYGEVNTEFSLRLVRLSAEEKVLIALALGADPHGTCSVEVRDRHKTVPLLQVVIGYRLSEILSVFLQYGANLERLDRNLLFVNSWNFSSYPGTRCTDEDVYNTLKVILSASDTVNHPSLKGEA